MNHQNRSRTKYLTTVRLLRRIKTASVSRRRLVSLFTNGDQSNRDSSRRSIISRADTTMKCSRAQRRNERIVRGRLSDGGTGVARLCPRRAAKATRERSRRREVSRMRSIQRFRRRWRVCAATSVEALLRSPASRERRDGDSSWQSQRRHPVRRIRAMAVRSTHMGEWVCPLRFPVGVSITFPLRFHYVSRPCAPFTGVRSYIKPL